MSFEDFSQVYKDAYDMGCKGCTTYRPDPTSGRGSVLSVVSDEPTPETTSQITVASRPEAVDGRTYKLKWPITNKNWYVTLTSIDGTPLEMFIVPGDPAASDWVGALSRTVTAVLRRGGDVRFLVEQLAEVHSPMGGAFIPSQERFRPSVVAAIAGVMEIEFRRLGLYGATAVAHMPPAAAVDIDNPVGEACPVCAAKAFVREAGCSRCLTCGYNSCG
jgi:ribonucleoside-diphosphate reductase alpha chain